MHHNNYFKKCILIVLIINAVFASSSLYSQEKPRIAILDFTPENTQITYAKAVQNIFEISLFKTNKFHILERNKMESILQEQGFQMSGCTDTSCAVQIGRILSADMVVIGSLNKIAKYTITVKFINIADGNIELADSETAENDDAIQQSVKTLANRMAGNITSKKTEATFTSQEITRKKQEEEVILNLSVYGMYLFPIGTFADLVKQGYGTSVLLYTDGTFIQNLAIGFETGYIRFQGKRQSVDYCSMIPALANLGYFFNIYCFNIIPRLSAGISYNTVSYNTVKSKTEFIAKTGIDVMYNFTEKLAVKISAEYGAVFEKDENLYFTALIAGINFQF